MVPKTYIPPYSWNIILYNHYIFQKVYQCLIIKGFNYLIMSHHNEKLPWILILWTSCQSWSQIGNIPLSVSIDFCEFMRFLWLSIFTPNRWQRIYSFFYRSLLLLVLPCGAQSSRNLFIFLLFLLLLFLPCAAQASRLSVFSYKRQGSTFLGGCVVNS